MQSEPKRSSRAATKWVPFGAALVVVVLAILIGLRGRADIHSAAARGDIEALDDLSVGGAVELELLFGSTGNRCDMQSA